MASNPTHNPHAFDSILNFRDVATTINAHSQTPLLKPGLLYRSARPDSATASDQQTLQTTLGIRTILDLRTPTEHLEARKKHDASLTLSSPVFGTPTPSDPTHPFRIPGLNYADVNLNGSAYTNALLRHLTWPQTLHLYFLYALNYRKPAIAILGTHVMAPRRLSGLAIDTLTHSTSEIKHVFSLLAEEDNWPVLIHCTQGKDRTGLVVLLLLLLCGVPEDGVEGDYMASQARLAGERAEKVAEVRSIGLPEGFADCEVGWVGKVRGWIEGERGGVEAYLWEWCGVSEEVRQRVRGILVVGERGERR